MKLLILVIISVKVSMSVKCLVLRPCHLLRQLLLLLLLLLLLWKLVETIKSSMVVFAIPNRLNILASNSTSASVWCSRQRRDGIVVAAEWLSFVLLSVWPNAIVVRPVTTATVVAVTVVARVATVLALSQRAFLLCSILATVPTSLLLLLLLLLLSAIHCLLLWPAL